MEYTIRVEGAEKIASKLNDLSKRQLPFALARALTQTVKAIQVDEKKEIKNVFDRPTPFIQNSFYIESATKTKLQAAIGIKDNAKKILSPHIIGGERGLKRFEYHLRAARILSPDKYVTPGVFAPLDRYGNIPGSFITQILSALKAHPDVYAWRTARSIRRRRGRVIKYVPIPEGRTIPAGIYRVEGRKLLPVMMFVKQPLYKKRFFFFEIAAMTANRKFNSIFSASLSDAISKAR